MERILKFVFLAFELIIAERNRNTERPKPGMLVYYASFAAIVILFFVLRIYDTSFVNGSDNYNVLGIKNLYENGATFYTYAPITDFLMLASVRLFSFNLFSIKIPFILYSFVTLIYLGLLTKQIDRTLSILSIFLYTISPWAIIQSHITRNYSFDLMVSTIAVYYIFLIYKRLQLAEHRKKLVFYAGLFLLIPISIYLLARYNFKTIIQVEIFALSAMLVYGKHLLKRFPEQRFLNRYYYLLILPVLIFGFYLVYQSDFKVGFHSPDFSFLHMFFNPQALSPWHWYHGLNVSPVLIGGLFILGIFVHKGQIAERDLLRILFISFTIGILLYSFKFVSHLNYLPTRYLYIFFLPFVVLLSNGILNIVRVFPKFQQVLLIVFFLMGVNITSVIYAVKPVLAYEREGIANPQIDNIGVGRFEMLKLADYMKDTLKISDETNLVLCGRYEEIILYTNRKMDAKRKLVNPANKRTYNISVNTFVESRFFSYFELEKAISRKSGYYITNEPMAYLPGIRKEIVIENMDFTVNGTTLKYIGNINGFRIFFWENKG